MGARVEGHREVLETAHPRGSPKRCRLLSRSLARSLDGQPMYAAVTALTPYYDTLFADRLSGSRATPPYAARRTQVLGSQNPVAPTHVRGVPMIFAKQQRVRRCS